MRKLEPRETRLKQVSREVPALTLATHHDMTIIACQTTELRTSRAHQAEPQMYRTIQRHAKGLLNGTYKD